MWYHAQITEWLIKAKSCVSYLVNSSVYRIGHVPLICVNLGQNRTTVLIH
jgi:hypothetical protein